MVKQIILGQKDVKYLEYLATESKCCAGIITGQITNGKDFVARMIKCPTQMIGEDLKEWKAIKDVDGAWVAGHAGQVLPCLPGGISVIGLFLTGQSADRKLVMEKLKLLLYQMYKVVSKTEEAVNEHFFSAKSNDQSLFYTIFHVDSSTGIIINSQQYDIHDNKDVGRPLEIRQVEAVPWDCLETSLYVDHACLVSDQHKLRSVFKPFCHKISLAQFTLDGEYHQSTETLNTSSNVQGGKATRKKKFSAKQPPTKTFQCQIFIPNFAEGESNGAHDERLQLCASGTITSKAYAIPGTTVDKATYSLKRDIIQSIYQRCDILSEDVEESDGGLLNAPPSSLPRRVFASDGEIFFSEYLLFSEPIEDCLERYKDNLDLELERTDLLEESSKEIFGTPMIKPSNFCESEKKMDEVKCAISGASRTNVIATVAATGVAVIAWILSRLLIAEN